MAARKSLYLLPYLVFANRLLQPLLVSPCPVQLVPACPELILGIRQLFLEVGHLALQDLYLFVVGINENCDGALGLVQELENSREAEAREKSRGRRASRWNLCQARIAK